MAQTDSNFQEQFRRALSPVIPTQPDGPWGLRTIVNGSRNLGQVYRSGITAADKLIPISGALTLAAVTEAGSTLPNSALHVQVSAGNQWGVAGSGTSDATITPTLNQAVRVTIPQVVGATYYDIAIGTPASPLGVGRITEAQRAAGGFIISALGVVSAGGGAGAGQVDLGIIGTGVAMNASPFLQNNAYTPALVAPILSAGYTVAHVHVKYTNTDARVTPVLSLIPFFSDQISPTDWFQGTLQSMPLGTSDGASGSVDYRILIDGAITFVILVSAIAGTGAAASMWVDLA